MLLYNVSIRDRDSLQVVSMPLNIPGILVPFQLLIYPRLVIPSMVVKGKFLLHRWMILTEFG